MANLYQKIDLNKLIVYDIETLVNCIIICCKDFATGKEREFIFYNDKQYDEEYKKFFMFLRNCVRHSYTFVGFNNVNFDAQVIDYYYDCCQSQHDPLFDYEPPYIIDALYGKAQQIINLPKETAYETLVTETKLFSPQIDVFKQLHYDRKRTSLKWVQFSMNYPDIEEMPIPHDEFITKDQIADVVSYCWNDVRSTFTFFEKVKYETDVRLQMSEQFKVNVVNAAEPRMVREIFATFITKQMGITYSELKELRTVRPTVAFEDIIFPYIKFITPEFNKVLQDFNQVVVNTDPGYTTPSKADIKAGLAKDESSFAYSFTLADMPIDLGLGGIHACAGGGVYTHEEDEVIEDADGKSFYPFLAIQNNLRPEHLGDAFNVVYPMMYDERLKYDKKDPRNYIFKIILNSAYGLSKEINGYLYDPKFTYAITINGQLSLLMLAEALHLSVPDISFIQMNTDGLTYKYKKVHESIVRKICKWWEKTTRIDLEYAYYDKMIFRDVNNYMAIDTKGEVKKKGCFETLMPYHKNPSSLIIPKALEAYFVNNLTIEDYICNPKNSIFDYCNGVKQTKDFKLNLVKSMSNFGSIEMLEQQQKVTRYIISIENENAGLLVKDFHDGRRVSVEAGKLCLPLNKINVKTQLEACHYPINYADYINETNRIIDSILNPKKAKVKTTITNVQQTLF